MLSLPDRWLWDQWYVHDGTRWHGYFLSAPKSVGDANLRHWHVTILHGVSDDLRDWQVLGPCFGPSEGPAWDDCTTWTGCVIRGDDRRWHLFYTGTSKAEGGLRQRIGHAVSDDLHAWARVGDGPILDRAAPYEEHDPTRWHDRAFRDPWVFRDPAGDGWRIVFTARDGRVSDPLAAGCIGTAHSPDLVHWTLGEPIFTGGFGELEVPQILPAGDRWACLFCTTAPYWSDAARARFGAPASGTHYLLADTLDGPWDFAPAPLLDMAPYPRRYAGRIVEQDGPKLMTFHWSDTEGGPFIGTVADPISLHRLPDGRLGRA